MLDQRRSLQGGPAATIARRLQEELRRSNNAALLAIEELLLELVATVCADRGGNTRAPSLGVAAEAARDLIHADLTARLSLAALAGAVGVHPITLATGLPGQLRLLGRHVRAPAPGRARGPLADRHRPAAGGDRAGRGVLRSEPLLQSVPPHHRCDSVALPASGARLTAAAG